MRNSLFFRWLAGAISFAFLLHLLLPGKAVHGGKDADVANVATPQFVGLDKYYNPSLDINGISDIEALQTADAFLPYFALLPTLPDLDATDAFGTCNFTDEELRSFQYDSDSWWRVEQQPESEISPLRTQWHTFIQHGLVPWSQVSELFKGSGIVIVAGDEQSVKRAKVTLRVLREHHDTSLPVELHHYTERELPEAVKGELQAIYGADLTFVDLSQRRQIWQLAQYGIGSIGQNFQLKVAAILNSRFSDVLLLDSDNIPTIDPLGLFDSDTYKKYGSVFWPDVTRTRPEHPAWRMTNTPCRRDEYEFETGQIMVNKSRLWYHLQFVSWMHTQTYWREIILGDKDMFRFAWHALRTDFGTPKKWLASIGFVAEQPRSRNDLDNGDVIRKYCGHTYAQHHPDHSTSIGSEGSGIAFLHGGNLKKLTAPLLARLKAAEGGVFTHYKSLDVETLEDWAHIEYGVRQIKWRSGWYLNLTREVQPGALLSAEEDFDLDGEAIGRDGLERLELTDADFKGLTMCTDFRNREPTKIMELGWEALGYEVLFSRAGGYWMIEDGRRT